MPEGPRTLVAKGDAVWIWPGVPLTVRCGTEILPKDGETIRFWLTRLHGPEALDKELFRAVEHATRHLKAGDESSAQHVLDDLHLTTLSPDGDALMDAVGIHLGIKVLDLPLRASMRTWNDRDIALHLAIFKRHFEAARALRKDAIPFDPAVHPRWPAGAPDSQGGEFAPAGAGAGAGDAAVIPAATRSGKPKPPARPKPKPPSPSLPQDESRFRYLEPGEFPEGANSPTGSKPENSRPGIGHNSGDKRPFDERPEIPKEEPIGNARYEKVKAIGRWMVAALAAGLAAAADRLLTNLRLIYWIMKAPLYYYAQLQANLDPPKTLDELHIRPLGSGIMRIILSSRNLPRMMVSHGSSSIHPTTSSIFRQ